MYSLRTPLLQILVFLCVKTAVSLYTHPNQRIVGGTKAAAGEFPFSVAVHLTTNNGQYFCGGALISNDWVLTAAQCAYGAVRFVLVLGANNLKESNPNKVTLAALEYAIHPDYDPETLYNDIALIRLTLPIEFTDYIKPIALPTAALDDHSVVVAIGWGQTSDDDVSEVSDLYRVTVTALTNDECRLFYGQTAVTDEMVCAEGNYNEGTCNGDSGSPLIRYTVQNEAIQVGISSWFSGFGCETPEPSGFTRTFPYVGWIRTVTGID